MYENLPILICIADDTKWLFFRIVPPPSAGEQYTTKLGFICIADIAKNRFFRITFPTFGRESDTQPNRDIFL